MTATMKSIPFALLLLALPLWAEEKEMKTLLQQGLVAEEVNGDLEAAAAAYQQLVTAGEAQQRLLATGLFRLAEVRRKQGQRDEAVALLQRLVTAHPAQEELVERAREALTGLGVAPPVTPEDSLMPSLATEEAQEIARMERLLRESPDRARKEYPLHLAAEKGWLELARRMIGQGYDVNQVRQDGMDGTLNHWRSFTPLAVAAEHGHKDMCQLLIQAKADINEGGENGCYPIRLAIVHRNEAILELLLEAGASVDVAVPLRPASFWGSDKALGTPLHLACQTGGTLSMVRMLLRAGANVEAVTKVNPDTIEHSQRFNSSVNVRFIAGHTPLFYAFAKKDVMDALFEAGASLKAADELGRTILFIATQYSDDMTLELVSHLVQSGAEVDARDQEGMTALLFAARYYKLAGTRWNRAKELVSLGADPKAVDLQGNGLLHHVANLRDGPLRSSDRYGGLTDDAVKWLMSLPLDAALKNSDGKTALELAVTSQHNNSFFVSCLLSATLTPDEGVRHSWPHRVLTPSRLYTAMSENEPLPDLGRGVLLSVSLETWDPRRIMPVQGQQIKGDPAAQPESRRRQLISAPIQPLGMTVANSTSGPTPDILFVVSKSPTLDKTVESVRRYNQTNFQQALSEKLRSGEVLLTSNASVQSALASMEGALERVTFRHGEREESFELSAVATSKFSSDTPVRTVGLVYSHYGAVVMAAAAELAAGKISRAKVIREIDGKPVERVIDLDTEDPGTWPRPMTGDVVELLAVEKVGGN